MRELQTPRRAYLARLLRQLRQCRTGDDALRLIGRVPHPQYEEELRARLPRRLVDEAVLAEASREPWLAKTLIERGYLTDDEIGRIALGMLRKAGNSTIPAWTVVLEAIQQTGRTLPRDVAGDIVQALAGAVQHAGETSRHNPAAGFSLMKATAAILLANPSLEARELVAFAEACGWDWHMSLQAATHPNAGVEVARLAIERCPELNDFLEAYASKPAALADPVVQEAVRSSGSASVALLILPVADARESVETLLWVGAVEPPMAAAVLQQPERAPGLRGASPEILLPLLQHHEPEVRQAAITFMATLRPRRAAR